MRRHNTIYLFEFEYASMKQQPNGIKKDNEINLKV